MKSKRIISTVLILLISICLSACIIEPYDNSNEEEASSNTSSITLSIDEAESTNGTTIIVVPENAIPEPYEDVITDINDCVYATLGDDYVAADDMRQAHFGVCEEAASIGTDDAYERICFALVDIDNNGIDELIIAVKNSDDPLIEYTAPTQRAGYTILEIYTLNNNEATRVIESWARCRWYLNSDFQLVCEGSSGAFDYSIDIYATPTDINNLVEIQNIHTEYNEETGELHFFDSTDTNNSDESAENEGTENNGWNYVEAVLNETTLHPCELNLVPINAPRV